MIKHHSMLVQGAHMQCRTPRLDSLGVFQKPIRAIELPGILPYVLRRRGTV